MHYCAGLIVFRGDNLADMELLLMQDPKNGWSPPKGHNNEGESDRQAAIRETQEETGLVTSDYNILPGFRAECRYVTHNGREKRVVYFLAELVTTKTSCIRVSSEHKAYGWFSLEAACQKLDKQEVKKALQDAGEFLAKCGKYK